MTSPGGRVRSLARDTSTPFARSSASSSTASPPKTPTNLPAARRRATPRLPPGTLSPHGEARAGFDRDDRLVELGRSRGDDDVDVQTTHNHDRRSVHRCRALRRPDRRGKNHRQCQQRDSRGGDERSRHRGVSPTERRRPARALESGKTHSGNLVALCLSPAFFDAASASARGARRLTTDTRARRRGVA